MFLAASAAPAWRVSSYYILAASFDLKTLTVPKYALTVTS